MITFGPVNLELHFSPIDLINVRLNMSEANNGQALSHPQHKQHLPDGHQRTMIWR